MAAGTYTSTVFGTGTGGGGGPRGAPVKVNQFGLITIGGQFTSTAPTTNPNSLGDVIFLAKVPHGAVVVDFEVDHSTSETTAGIKYGVASGAPSDGAASLSWFSPSLATATVKTRWTAGTIARNAARTGIDDPYRISVSDTDPNRYGIFAAKLATGSFSTTFIINFSITYRMDTTPGGGGGA